MHSSIHRPSTVWHLEIAVHNFMRVCMRQSSLCTCLYTHLYTCPDTDPHIHVSIQLSAYISTYMSTFILFQIDSYSCTDAYRHAEKCIDMCTAMSCTIAKRSAGDRASVLRISCSDPPSHRSSTTRRKSLVSTRPGAWMIVVHNAAPRCRHIAGIFIRS